MEIGAAIPGVQQREVLSSCRMGGKVILDVAHRPVDHQHNLNVSWNVGSSSWHDRPEAAPPVTVADSSLRLWSKTGQFGGTGSSLVLCLWLACFVVFFAPSVSVDFALLLSFSLSGGLDPRIIGFHSVCRN